MLKSSFTNSSRIGLALGHRSYKSMNHRASNLSILQCRGSSRACFTMISRFISMFCRRFSLRCLVANSLAISSVLSPSIERYVASYKYYNPFVSSLSLGLKLPFSFLKQSNISAIKNGCSLGKLRNSNNKADDKSTHSS